MSKIAKFVIALLLIAGVSAVLFMKTGTAASAPANKPLWNASIEMSPEQLSYAHGTIATMSAYMQSKGVGNNIVADRLELSGSQGIQQMRSALFDDTAQWVDFRGGPVELTLALPAGNAPFTLKLEARLTAGYSWEVLAAPQSRYVQNGEASSVMRYSAYGAPVIQTFQLQSNGKGNGTVRLVYRRPFEKDAPIHARLTLQVIENGGLIELTDPTPTPPTASENVSQASDEPNPYDTLPNNAALPASWDWRTQGIVPPVRDQKSCGSCWAFSTVGVMESAIKKGGGPFVDLSEQFLVSCNKDGWSCDGGLIASKYHYNTLAKSQTAVGSVLESVKPYTATNGTCSVALPHSYKANSWQFIVPTEWTMPTVTQIKNAIYTYGPVTAAVCAGPAFQNYTPGTIFSTDESATVCNGGTDHDIVLVGWNDATQSWILRNSWNTYWGNSGYMNIKWGTSRVGQGASWIKYVGGPIVVPTPISPSGTTTDTTPTYTFSKVSGATQYEYQLYKGTALVYDKLVAASACGSTANCVNTPTTVLPKAAYTWKVRAFISTWRAYSTAKSFTIGSAPAGFNSQFTSDAAGWVPVNGAWSVASGYYKSPGISGMNVSSAHTGNFSTLTYEVKMYRTGCVDCANFIYFRGSPQPLTSTGGWNNGLRLTVSNDGYYQIGYYQNGNWYFIIPWTTSSVVSSGWNTLKVTMNGIYVHFFINGTQVAYGTLSGFSSTGQVGVSYYQDSSSGNMLNVDYATLSMSAPASASINEGINLDTLGPINTATAGNPNVAP